MAQFKTQSPALAQFQAPALLAARVLLSAIFITSGLQKITGYADTAGYMEFMGVPAILLPLAILAEIGGGLAILAGFQTRLAAISLAGFSVVTGYLFHYAAITGEDAMGDMMQMIMFMKNLTIAGGFLALFAAGPGAWSLDGRRSLRPAFA